MSNTQHGISNDEGREEREEERKRMSNTQRGMTNDEEREICEVRRITGLLF